MSKEYSVLKIMEMMRPSDTQGVEKFYRHQIKTAGGTILTVDIDADKFTPEKSAPILAKAAQNADTILKG